MSEEFDNMIGAYDELMDRAMNDLTEEELRAFCEYIGADYEEFVAEFSS